MPSGGPCLFQGPDRGLLPGAMLKKGVLTLFRMAKPQEGAMFIISLWQQTWFRQGTPYPSQSMTTPSAGTWNASTSPDPLSSRFMASSRSMYWIFTMLPYILSVTVLFADFRLAYQILKMVQPNFATLKLTINVAWAILCFATGIYSLRSDENRQCQ